MKPRMDFSSDIETETEPDCVDLDSGMIEYDVGEPDEKDKSIRTTQNMQ